MTRTSRFLAGVSVGYTHQVAVTIAGLWLTPFLLWRLGAHEYGLWLTATQLIAYLTLLDLGVLALLPREAAYATGRAGGALEAADLPVVVGRTAGIVFWQLPIIIAITAAAWWCIPQRWSDLQGPLALLLIAFVLTYPLRIFQATLQGLQDLAFVGAVQLSAWLLGTAVMLFLVFNGWRLGALAVGAAVTQVAALGGCASRVVGRFPFALPRRLPRVRWEEAGPHLKRAAWVSVSQIAQVLVYATDLVIVAWVFGPVTVVPYACTQKLIAVLANQPQLLTQAAAPALSELRMGAPRPKLFTVTSSLSLALMLTSGAVVVVVLAVNRAFVSWWVGADQYGGAMLTGLFAAAMLARHWNTALVYSLFSFGHERRLSLTAVADGVVTLILSLLLARTIGVIGVPLGFLSGALFVSVPLNLLALARETGVKPGEFMSSLAPWGIRLLAVLPVAAAANVFVRSPRLGAIALAAGLAAAAYTIIMFPIALRPPLGDYVRRSVESLSRALRFRRSEAAAGAPVSTK